MRHKVATVAGIAFAAALAFFLLVPVVQTPIVITCGGGCGLRGGYFPHDLAYESFSCYFLGIGVYHRVPDGLVVNGEAYFQLGCPPLVIYIS